VWDSFIYQMQIASPSPEMKVRKEMNLWTDHRIHQQPLPPKLSVANLKVCPLCDSLNARSNNACFVCGWQGQFIHDRHQVHLSLVLLMEQCPELSDGIRTATRRPTLWVQVVTFLRDKFTRHRKLDLWA
jgi:hypothetical protein